MKLQGFKSLQRDDVKDDYKPLVDKIAFSINPFADEVIRLTNKRITIEDNLNEEIKVFKATVNSSGTPTSILRLKTILTGKISGIAVIKAENLTNSVTYPTTCPFISYTENGDIITIKNITGLQADNEYRLTIRIQ